MTAEPRPGRARTVGRALTLGAALATGLTGCGAAEPATDENLGALDRMWLDASEESERSRQAEIERRIAECMSEEGFEYIPVEEPTADDEDVPDPGTVEFAEQWGYGIVDNPWDAEQSVQVGLAADDPNRAIVDAMSEAEREAYYAALWGPQMHAGVEPDEDGGYEPPSWQEMGCAGAAYHEVQGAPLTAPAQGIDDPLWDEMVDLERATAADPRVLAAEAEWASCMADAGHPEVTAIGQGEQSIQEQADQIRTEGYADVRVDPTDESVAAAERAIRERLAELQRVEIELAVADVTCRSASGYDEAWREVNRVLQQEFVDANRAELEAWFAENVSGSGR